MGSYAKQKGNTFEREVAKFLTETLQCGEFQRTKGSGAFYGKSNKHRLQNASQAAIRAMRGDIIPPDNINLVVECKNHKAFSGGFHSIMMGSSSQLDKWLAEVYEDSEQDKIPNFLVFKITGTQGAVFYALSYNHFKDTGYKDYTYTEYYSEPLDTTYLIVGAYVIQEIAQDIVYSIQNK